MKSIRRIDQANLIPLKDIQHKQLPPHRIEDTSTLTPEELKTYQAELRKHKLQSALERALRDIHATPLEESDFEEDTTIARPTPDEYFRSTELERQRTTIERNLKTIASQKQTHDINLDRSDLQHCPRANIVKK